MSEQKKEKQYERTIMGKTLMLLRKMHKLTQEQVADILKIKRSTYAYYERDITPTLENIKKLSILFNASVHFLMYGEEEERYDGIGGLGTPTPEEALMKCSELKRDEALLLAHFRLLSAQNKEKIHKEVNDLFDKSE